MLFIRVREGGAQEPDPSGERQEKCEATAGDLIQHGNLRVVR